MKSNALIYTALGIMSGTSLDGVDLALCTFEEHTEGWNFNILKAKTIAYSDEWKKRLTDLPSSGSEVYNQADREYGQYLGTLVSEFLESESIKPQLIASHGHTIFHNPAKGFTAQLGYGGAIAAKTRITTVSDFRSIDIMLGGQGAPLVPIGDELLFSQYDQCLNLGGFANISYSVDGIRLAGDISVCNFILNNLAANTGQLYDKDGALAAKGIIIPCLLEELNSLPFYNSSFPRSLGREWVEENILPYINPNNYRVEDLLATFTEHIALKIAGAINQSPGKKILATGGGVYNNFLIKRIRYFLLNEKEFEIGNTQTVEYKEAMIFAFLGVLRLLNRTNVLCSVTGSQRNHCAGAIFHG